MHLRVATVVLAVCCTLARAFDLTNPKSIPLSSATCGAVNRATGVTKDIEIKYADFNPKAERTLLLVHGWPSVWHIWRDQIAAFKEDYRVIAVNLRGFGGSEHPGDVETSSTMSDLVGDLACVLANAKVSSAVCVGHDWGTQVCYEGARMRPDLFNGVIGTTIPYIPYAGPFVPIANLVSMLPKLAYNVFFEAQTADAVKELNRDVRRSLRAVMRSVDSAPPEEFLKQTDSFMRGWDSVDVIPSIPFFTKGEEDYWVEEFEKHGFDHTLGFYTHGTRHGSWAFAQSQGNHTIPQPVLSILPTNDPVANWIAAAELMKSDTHTPRLTLKTLDAAHWALLEKAAEMNAFMKEWLDVYYPATSRGEEGTHGHVKEEL